MLESTQKEIQSTKDKAKKEETQKIMEVTKKEIKPMEVPASPIVPKISASSLDHKSVASIKKPDPKAKQEKLIKKDEATKVNVTNGIIIPLETKNLSQVEVSQNPNVTN